jgi:hypothetical protein
MRLPEFVAVSAPLIVSWTLQLGSVYALLLALPRLMEPSEYATATAALSVYLVITAPCVALQASDSASARGVGSSSDGWSSRSGDARLCAGDRGRLPPAGGATDILVVALPASILASARMQELRRSGARSVRSGRRQAPLSAWRPASRSCSQAGASPASWLGSRSQMY